MAIDVESVIKQLTEASIIAPGKLENFIPPKAHPKTVDELIQELVKSQELTAFQAAQVKAGKAKALILGEYTILDKIGAGGMGQVFKARHRRMKRIVAIKMLPPAMTKDAAALARFEREVEAAAKLNHQNIVAAYDAGQANNAHFLVMEFVDGKDLSAMVKKDGPFPVGKAVNYILQTARGLEFAHGEGVVHRDIKPANLLLDKKGVVKILDMGLARIESDGAAQTELTGTGTIMGTVDYMSPEQAINTKHADHRADIYSLGMSLYYLLAGKAVYGGETAMEKLMAHQNQPIPSLRDTQTTVSKQLDAVFHKMAAKRIEDRYQSVTEVVEALEGLGLGGSVTSNKGDVASTIDLSSADRKKLLASKATKKPLGSLTDVVASEKSKNVVAKIVGGAFATIIAPILVTYLIRYLEKKDEPANPPAATAPATTVAASGNSPLLPPGEGFGASAQPSGGRRPDEGELAASMHPHPSAAQPPSPGGRRVDAKPPLATPAKAIAPFDATQAKAHQAAWAKHLGTQVETTNSIGMRLTLIPPGEFLMGSTPEQVAWGRKSGEEDEIAPTDKYYSLLAEEMPQHKVTISQPFLMGSTEVTVAQFRKFVEASKYITEAEKHGSGNSGERTLSDKVQDADKGRNWKNPGYATTDDTAVTHITWNDAVAYCAWLSEQEQRRPPYRTDGKGGWLIVASGDGYRLATEAEWEYACRAGTTTQYSFGDDKTQLEQYAWFNKNASGKTQPVALKLPNPFDLFDMHGNAQEWCQDWYHGKWYEKSSPADPNGPSSGSSRLIRGGIWPGRASSCRSAFRYNHSPSFLYYTIGFRIVRPLDATQPEAAVAMTAKPGASPTKATKPWESPAFQAWIKDVQAMPAEKQVEAVSKKLMELNPGFDGKFTDYNGAGMPRIENGVVTKLRLLTNKVTDLSPVRALVGLRELECVATGAGSRLFDLSPLRGLNITTLGCSNTQVADLSPLEGMKLTWLHCGITQVSDLSPLQGMQLTFLDCHYTQVSDLSPLRGMPLTKLDFHGTQVSDLSVLTSMRTLNDLKIIRTKITPAQVAALQKALPSCKIEWDDPSKAAKPWESPAFQQWIKDVQALPAEKQVEAVSKKLQELNPGFDGKMVGANAKPAPRIENGVVTDLGFLTLDIIDISPVRALAGLKALSCGGSGPRKGKLSDLSPLNGMQLTFLYCGLTQVSDLTPLKGMPLRALYCPVSQVSDLSPLQGMPLTLLVCNSCRGIVSLPSLAGMRLTTLEIVKTSVSDLSPLQDCKSLTFLAIERTKVTPAGVAALQKALPNCKIEWDDPAKAASSKKLAYLDLAFQAWVKDVQALPAEKQVEAVSKKLMELNPGFDGKITDFGGSGSPKIPSGVVTEIGFHTGHVTDLSPVQALNQLKKLACRGSGAGTGELSDLSPLRGMKLLYLHISDNQVSDLSPLSGMKLTNLYCSNTQISDLSALRAMPLDSLDFVNSPVSDLSPLIGAPLRSLGFSKTEVADLTPLAGMKLTTITFTPEDITAGLAVIRQMKSLQSFGISGKSEQRWSAAEFWKKYDAGEFGKPIASTKPWESPVFQQWIKDVQAMPAEKQVEAVSKKLMELNPGFDGKVTPKIQSGVVRIVNFVADNVADISPLRVLTGLNNVNCTGIRSSVCQLSDLSPLMGLPLKNLNCRGTQVADLAPLHGMKLETLTLAGTPVFDLAPLHDCGKLDTLTVTNTRVTPATVAALQKALPNCKIEWDDPAKPAAKKLTYLDPAFQKWVADTQKLPAEKQLEAVSKKLMELNPGFDGTLKDFDRKGTPKVENGLVTSFGFSTENVIDISPVRALVGLKSLNCGGSYAGSKSLLSDLSPLEGMKLTNLSFNSVNVSDLSPLVEMPLTKLYCYKTTVSNLAPLHGCKSLRNLTVTTTNVTPAQVSALQKALPNCKIEWDDPAEPKTPAPAPAGKK
ncbi:MAG TPA: SUMF1/EgtB/PvdO family nonheme iron enzyme [Pirellulales bacterium]|jgi:formylglycine-generating enzyme required for sulfatase activity/serine/threonine protein kinase/Leucine-rich repeat (LRR) protein|nr:SUMF1/EgtB/PvdO family nonheme iron enzyme [Pirellulales bacterium]